ncbi:hypothetical protein Tco_0998794 [Tanacetum coccineum]
MSASMEARIAEHAAAPTPPIMAAGIRMRAAVASPPSLLPPTSPRTDVLEAEMPPRKRACLTTPAPGYEIGESVAVALAERDASRSKDSDNNHGSGTGGRRQVPTHRECTYTDFLKCQPINFKGTKGVVCLTQWAEKMESVFLISKLCLLQYGYTTALKRMITDKYCPRGEIKKLESEYWNLKVRGHYKSRLPKDEEWEFIEWAGNGNAVARLMLWDSAD